MIWNKVTDKLPPTEGDDWIVVVRNKNKEGGIFLYDVGQYENGKWHKSGT